MRQCVAELHPVPHSLPAAVATPPRVSARRASPAILSPIPAVFRDFLPSAGDDWPASRLPVIANWFVRESLPGHGKSGRFAMKSTGSARVRMLGLRLIVEDIQ